MGSTTGAVWAASERHRTLHRRRKPLEFASPALCGATAEPGGWVFRELELITRRGYFPCRHCERALEAQAAAGGPA